MNISGSHITLQINMDHVEQQIYNSKSGMCIMLLGFKSQQKFLHEKNRLRLIHDLRKEIQLRRILPT